MREFNLEQALAGAPVVTRDGLKVEQLTLFKSRDVHCLMGVVDERVYAWNKEGNGYQLSMTLHMAPVKKTGWVARLGHNIYYVIFPSEESAKECVPEALSYHQIEWEEK